MNKIIISKGFLLIDSALDGKVEKRLESDYCGTLTYTAASLRKDLSQVLRETAPSYHRKQLPLTKSTSYAASLSSSYMHHRPAKNKIQEHMNTLRNEYFIASLMLVSLPKKSISMKLKIIRRIQGTP